MSLPYLRCHPTNHYSEYYGNILPLNKTLVFSIRVQMEWQLEWEIDGGNAVGSWKFANIENILKILTRWCLCCVTIANAIDSTKR